MVVLQAHGLGMASDTVFWSQFEVQVLLSVNPISTSSLGAKARFFPASVACDQPHWLFGAPWIPNAEDSALLSLSKLMIYTCS